MMDYILDVLPHNMISIGCWVKLGFQNRNGFPPFYKNTFELLFSEEAMIGPKTKD